MSQIRTRFAPSPTGSPESIHLGFVIRALWNYAYAKKNGGKFILRIEDTDKERSRKDTEEAICETLKDFNIIWDEGPDVGGPCGPYRQSERLDKYKAAAIKLVENGYAYYDFDANKREIEEIDASYEDEEELKKLKKRPEARNQSIEEVETKLRNKTPYVVRVKIPENANFQYFDWILKKTIKFKGSEVSDMIILKSDGFPTYHLAVVVDDADMKISHVFRGQEWISSTPVHLHIYEGLGLPKPEIGHFSVIIDPRTGKKFSKRDLSAMFGVTTWTKKGYLKEAILNYLMLLGWAPKDNREIFSLAEFVNAFDQDGVQKGNPIFDEKKLTWMNGQYLMSKSVDEWTDLVYEFYDGKYAREEILQIALLVQTRVKTLAEFERLCNFFVEAPKEVDNSLLSEKYKPHISSATVSLAKLDDWSLEKINNSLSELVEEKNLKTGDFFMDLRIAITGNKMTPPINESLVILGKEETLKRLKKLI